MAEKALECCRLVLEACPVTSGERLLELLQRIGAVAALGRKAAAEEVSCPFPMHYAMETNSPASHQRMTHP